MFTLYLGVCFDNKYYLILVKYECEKLILHLETLDNNKRYTIKSNKIIEMSNLEATLVNVLKSSACRLAMRQHPFCLAPGILWPLFSLTMHSTKKHKRILHCKTKEIKFREDKVWFYDLLQSFDKGNIQIFIVMEIYFKSC